MDNQTTQNTILLNFEKNNQEKIPKILNTQDKILLNFQIITTIWN